MAWPRRSCSARTHLRARPCGSRKGARVLTRIYAMGRGYNSGLNRQLRVNRDNYSVEPIYTYFTHCTYYAGTTTPSSTSPPRSSSVPRPASITTSYTPEPVELHTAPTAPCAHRCAARRSCASACGSCLSHRSSSAWYRSRCSNPITLTLNPTLTTNSSPSPNPNQPSS